MDRAIYLVRHTRTVVKEGICYGQSDVELADDFEPNSVIIQRKLEGVNFDRVYCSPLKRCTQLASALSSEILIDERLMEMNFGEWEGATWEYIFSLPQGKDWFSDHINNRCPKGEAFSDLIERVNLFLSDLKQTQGDVLIVTHAGVIRAIASCLGATTKESAFDLSVPFGGVFKIVNNEITAR